jgi:hypothetical protein
MGKKLNTYMQGCGFGVNDFVDPDSESGSMGKKNNEKNAHFLNFLLHFYRKVENSTDYKYF